MPSQVVPSNKCRQWHLLGDLNQVKLTCMHIMSCVHIDNSVNQCFCCFRPNSTLRTLNANEASMWVKVISSWLCLALYTWTLVAPILLPNREFNWTASTVCVFKTLRYFMYVYIYIYIHLHCNIIYMYIIFHYKYMMLIHHALDGYV